MNLNLNDDQAVHQLHTQLCRELLANVNLISDWDEHRSHQRQRQAALNFDFGGRNRRCELARQAGAAAYPFARPDECDYCGVDHPSDECTSLLDKSGADEVAHTLTDEPILHAILHWIFTVAAEIYHSQFPDSADESFQWLTHSSRCARQQQNQGQQ